MEIEVVKVTQNNRRGTFYTSGQSSNALCLMPLLICCMHVRQLLHLTPDIVSPNGRCFSILKLKRVQTFALLVTSRSSMVEAPKVNTRLEYKSRAFNPHNQIRHTFNGTPTPPCQHRHMSTRVVILAFHLSMSRANACQGACKVSLHYF